MDVENYRDIIRRKRKKAGWSQYKLAREVGITQSFMNEIEGGKKSPSIDVFFRICEALEIKVFPDEE
ncbi:MAG: helix-turn-helix transcriptional regulator [Lawsonibacter sp.]|nr:helix-turn-helix transcriptional regulator [Lawsonibacter sp.]